MYRVLAAVLRTLPTPLLVGCEGVAGEYAQSDFGDVSVRLAVGRRRVVRFAAYRLEYSRRMHVEVVPDERVEGLIGSLIGSLLTSFAGSGGVPLCAPMRSGAARAIAAMAYRRW